MVQKTLLEEEKIERTISIIKNLKPVKNVSFAAEQFKIEAMPLKNIRDV